MLFQDLKPGERFIHRREIDNECVGVFIKLQPLLVQISFTAVLEKDGRLVSMPNDVEVIRIQ